MRIGPDFTVLRSFWHCNFFIDMVLYTGMYIQGDPNQKLLIQIAITLKICISDPKLVKPKCVLEAYIYFENCKQTTENCKQTAKN